MSDMKQKMGEKLRKLRELKKLTRKQFADKLGVSPSTIRDWENGINGIKPEMQKKITEKFGLPHTYFLEEEFEFDISDKVPILGYVRAGEPIMAIENIIGYIKPPEWVKADFALVVRGDSMEPVYYDGMLVFIKQQPVVDNGEIAVVLVGGDDATLKKVKYSKEMIQLVPFNTARYDIIECDPAEVNIIGKVVYPLPEGGC
jgi:repressor LexA